MTSLSEILHHYNPYTPATERMDTPPSVEFVLSLKRDYAQYYQAFHQQCATEEMYYFGQNPVPVPEPFEPVRPATPRALINVGTDHVDVNNIEIEVPSSPRSRARAERLKKFYQGAWASQKGPVLRTAVKHGFLYGTAFLKVMYDIDQWPNAPVMDDYGITDTDGHFLMVDESGYKDALQAFMEAQYIRWPLVVQNINPKNLLWDDSRAGTRWVIETYEREVNAIKRRYPQWVTDKETKQMASWLEYWDDIWCGYMADNQWVWGPYRHGYGGLNYVQLQTSNSLEWDCGPPEKRYQGLLHPVHSLLDEEARLTSAYNAMIRQYAWRTMDFHGPQGPVEATMDQYELWGGKNWVRPNVSVAVSPSATPPPELLQELNMIQTMIEEATFPNVIRGVRPKGVSSGFGISVLSGMGRLVFQGVANGTSRAVEQANSCLAMIVENRIQGPVTVHARSDVHNFDQTIGPDDIRGLYENIVKMKAEAPEERERESLLALRLYRDGIISLLEAQRRSGVINPLEEQNQIAAERILQSPEFVQEQIRLAAEGMGLLQQLGEAAGVAQEAGLGMEMPPGGAPGFGNEFLPGQAQLQRPGERNIQASRMASLNQEPSVFPEGMGGIDQLAARLGTAPGSPTGMPSGEVISPNRVR
jgi:hypothetical protein